MHHFENRKMGILERVQRNGGMTKATMTRTEKRKWSRFGREDEKSGKPCQQRYRAMVGVVLLMSRRQDQNVRGSSSNLTRCRVVPLWAGSRRSAPGGPHKHGNGEKIF